MEILPGRYRHFKGGEYEVLGVARHSETQEEFVVYRHLSGPTSPAERGGLWIRPATMFTETVVRYGRRMGRFEFIGE